MKRTIQTLLLALAACLLFIAPAQGAFGLKELGIGMSGTAAGTHPEEVTTTLQMNTIVEGTPPDELEYPDGQMQTIDIEMPEGFAGNPTAVPACDPARFREVLEAVPNCPNATAVGYAAVKAEFDPIPPNSAAYFHVPLFNLGQPAGRASRLGFAVLGVPVTIDVGVRESPPYNIYARVTYASEAALFYGSKVTIWGNPADKSHDPYRGRCLNALSPGSIDEILSKGNCPAEIPEVPFLTTPRSCEGPLVANFLARAWNNVGEAKGSASAPTRQGCSKLGLEVQTASELDTTAAESPSGLAFDLTIDDPGYRDADATTFSDIRRTKVIFPAGVTVNTSQAEGLAACSEADLARETASSQFGEGCPAASRIGAVEVETPLLENRVLKGSLFVATPFQNPFGSLIAVYMVIKDRDLGVAVKMPARVQTDPVSGQVSTTFGDPSSKVPGYRDLPQVPLSRVHVQLRGGERSALVTPPTCGTYTTRAIFTPWSGGPDLEVPSSFQVTSGPGGGPCPLGPSPFSPGFDAGSINNAAGAYSPFYIRLTRNDAEPLLTRFDAVLPEGVVPKLAGVPHCPDAAIEAAKARSGKDEIASPSCPAASQIGTVAAGAGVGPALTWVGGKVYLAGPFAGAPMSVVVITPAVAGPFDVGTVVVREGIDINPVTYVGEVSGAASEPIPTILEGIPLKLRDLRVSVDRAQFMRNPTSCAQKQVQASAFAGSLLAPLSQRFQAADCASLGFKPKLKLRFKGQMKRSGNPAVSATLTPREGDANLGAATVLLPPTQLIDNAHVNNPCTRAQFAANACPPSSILGTAKAFTPLLEVPFEGPIYFRSNGGERELPDMVADLRGAGFRITSVGFIDSRNSRVRTRFLSVPDAPISKIELNFYGGKRGLLENNRNLCKAKNLRAKAALVGQNGRRSDTEPKIATSCKRKKGAKAKKSAGRR